MFIFNKDNNNSNNNNNKRSAYICNFSISGCRVRIKHPWLHGFPVTIPCCLCPFYYQQKKKKKEKQIFK